MPELFYYPAFWIFVAILLLVFAVFWHGAQQRRFTAQPQWHQAQQWHQEPSESGQWQAPPHPNDEPYTLDPAEQGTVDQVNLAAPVIVDTKALVPWVKPAVDIVTRLKNLVGLRVKGLTELADHGLGADPLLTLNQAHLLGVLNSAVTRHGFLIEKGIAEVLKDYERFAVWPNVTLEISGPNGEECNRQIDLIAFDKAQNVVRGYEVKRGFADSLGSHVERQSRQDWSVVERSLIPWVASKGYRAERAAMHFVSYYGKTFANPGSGKPSLSSHSLDEHFGLPMVRRIEEMTGDYKGRLQGLLVSEGLWSHETTPTQQFQSPENPKTNVVGFKAGMPARGHLEITDGSNHAE